MLVPRCWVDAFIVDQHVPTRKKYVISKQFLCLSNTSDEEKDFLYAVGQLTLEPVFRQLLILRNEKPDETATYSQTWRV